MAGKGKRAQKKGKGAPGAPAAGGTRMEVLARSDGMEGILVTVDAGAGWGQVYSHAGEEIRYILDGELEVDVGGKRYLLEKGDCLWHRAEVPHTMRNPGKKLARYFVVIMPPSFS